MGGPNNAVNVQRDVDGVRHLGILLQVKPDVIAIAVLATDKEFHAGIRVELPSFPQHVLCTHDDQMGDLNRSSVIIRTSGHGVATMQYFVEHGILARRLWDGKEVGERLEGSGGVEIEGKASVDAIAIVTELGPAAELIPLTVRISGQIPDADGHAQLLLDGGTGVVIVKAGSELEWDKALGRNGHGLCMANATDDGSEIPVVTTPVGSPGDERVFVNRLGIRVVWHVMDGIPHRVSVVLVLIIWVTLG
jgi:hypothetical protein